MNANPYADSNKISDGKIKEMLEELLKSCDCEQEFIDACKKEFRDYFLDVNWDDDKKFCRRKADLLINGREKSVEASVLVSKKISDDEIKAKLEELLKNCKSEQEFEAACKKEFGRNISISVIWKDDLNHRSALLRIHGRKEEVKGVYYPS